MLRPAKANGEIVEFDANGVRTGVVEVEKVAKPDSEWKKQLTAEQFEVTRQAGAEFPGSGKYAKKHADGLYHCICCDAVLFDSKENVKLRLGADFGCRRELYGELFTRVCFSLHRAGAEVGLQPLHGPQHT